MHCYAVFKRKLQVLNLETQIWQLTPLPVRLLIFCENFIKTHWLKKEEIFTVINQKKYNSIIAYNNNCIFM